MASERERALAGKLIAFANELEVRASQYAGCSWLPDPSRPTQESMPGNWERTKVATLREAAAALAQSYAQPYRVTELDELKLIAEENAENVKLLDYISDKIGLPHDEELSQENFGRWFSRQSDAQPQDVREALAPLQEILSDLLAIIPLGVRTEYRDIVERAEMMADHFNPNLSFHDAALAQSDAQPGQTEKNISTLEADGWHLPINASELDGQIKAEIALDFARDIAANCGHDVDEIASLIERAIDRAASPAPPSDARSGLEEAAEWQPIDSAPIDGKPFLLFARHVDATASIIVVGAYLREYGWISHSFIGQGIAHIVPSHWRELPDFPRASETQGGGE